jgi:hypothetical protein
MGLVPDSEWPTLYVWELCSFLLPAQVDEASKLALRCPAYWSTIPGGYEPNSFILADPTFSTPQRPSQQSWPADTAINSSCKAWSTTHTESPERPLTVNFIAPGAKYSNGNIGHWRVASAEDSCPTTSTARNHSQLAAMLWPPGGILTCVQRK